MRLLLPLAKIYFCHSIVSLKCGSISLAHCITIIYKNIKQKYGLSNNFIHDLSAWPAFISKLYREIYVCKLKLSSLEEILDH